MKSFGLIEVLGVPGLTAGFCAWQMRDLNADKRAMRRASGDRARHPEGSIPLTRGCAKRSIESVSCTASAGVPNRCVSGVARA